MKTSRLLLLALALCGAPSLPAAPVPARVAQFFDNLVTLQADFDQQVTDANHQPVQSSQGQLWIQRPGKFRWNYATPYRQQLVADGERVWTWDEDLEQVTVQPAEEILTATPAMLLSGNRPLSEVFEFSSGADNSVLLTPKNSDSNITTLTLGFDGDTLSRIEAYDSFGNTTVFSFSHMQRNARLDPGLFHFVPPPGADVVGEVP